MRSMVVKGGTMRVTEDVCVMGEDPVPGRMPEEVREWYRLHPGEAGLAQAYADASNKLGWIADEPYDHEEGSPEHEKACEAVLAWLRLTEELQMVILGIQRSRGDRIPKKGRFPILARFMERNG